MNNQDQTPSWITVVKRGKTARPPRPRPPLKPAQPAPVPEQRPPPTVPSNAPSSQQWAAHWPLLSHPAESDATAQKQHGVQSDGCADQPQEQPIQSEEKGFSSSTSGAQVVHQECGRFDDGSQLPISSPWDKAVKLLAEQRQWAVSADSSEQNHQKCINAQLPSSAVYVQPPWSALNAEEKPQPAAPPKRTLRNPAMEHSGRSEIEVELNRVMTEVQLALNDKHDIDVARKELMRARYAAAAARRLKRLEQMWLEEGSDEFFGKQQDSSFSASPAEDPWMHVQQQVEVGPVGNLLSQAHIQNQALMQTLPQMLKRLRYVINKSATVANPKIHQEAINMEARLAEAAADLMYNQRYPAAACSQPQQNTAFQVSGEKQQRHVEFQDADLVMQQHFMVQREGQAVQEQNVHSLSQNCHPRVNMPQQEAASQNYNYEQQQPHHHKAFHNNHERMQQLHQQPHFINANERIQQRHQQPTPQSHTQAMQKPLQQAFSQGFQESRQQFQGNAAFESDQQQKKGSQKKHTEFWSDHHGMQIPNKFTNSQNSPQVVEPAHQQAAFSDCHQRMQHPQKHDANESENHRMQRHQQYTAFQFGTTEILQPHPQSVIQNCYERMQEETVAPNTLPNSKTEINGAHRSQAHKHQNYNYQMISRLNAFSEQQHEPARTPLAAQNQSHQREPQKWGGGGGLMEWHKQQISLPSRKPDDQRSSESHHQHFLDQAECQQDVYALQQLHPSVQLPSPEKPLASPTQNSRSTELPRQPPGLYQLFPNQLATPLPPVPQSQPSRSFWSQQRPPALAEPQQEKTPTGSSVVPPQRKQLLTVQQNKQPQPDNLNCSTGPLGCVPHSQLDSNFSPARKSQSEACRYPQLTRGNKGGLPQTKCFPELLHPKAAVTSAQQQGQPPAAHRPPVAAPSIPQSAEEPIQQQTTKTRNAKQPVVETCSTAATPLTLERPGQQDQMHQVEKEHTPEDATGQTAKTTEEKNGRSKEQMASQDAAFPRSYSLFDVQSGQSDRKKLEERRKGKLRSLLVKHELFQPQEEAVRGASRALEPFVEAAAAAQNILGDHSKLTAELLLEGLLFIAANHRYNTPKTSSSICAGGPYSLSSSRIRQTPEAERLPSQERLTTTASAEASC